MNTFPLRGARSTAVTVTIGFVLVIETVAIHLLLSPHHAIIAWTVTLLSLVTLGWLVADYIALAESSIDVGTDRVRFAVGRRILAVVPRVRIHTAAVATWRDVPGRADASWLNATKPANPNVIVTFTEPTPVRLFGIATRQVTRLGVHVDNPLALAAALQGTPEAASSLEQWGPA